MFDAISHQQLAVASPTRRYGFGDFVLDGAELSLFENSRPVLLGHRALLLLLALVERPGEVVTRQTFENCAWPNSVLEQTSLRVHIGILRKTLRDGVGDARYITNVPGRGYCFTAPVKVLPELEPSPGPFALMRATSASKPVAPLGNLPPRLLPVVGRAEVTMALAAQLAQRRLVSLVGPGGIGKTTVALAVAHECAGHYQDGVWFVDLARLEDPSRLPSTLALTFGLPMARDATPEAAMKALHAFVHERKMLIVLDNCEHVIASAAVAAESLIQMAPRLHIIATTREPLDAEGEWIHRLAALQTPGVADCLSIPQALGFSAIKLFVDRATANASNFALTEATLADVRQICRQLDGVPLALELAAARVYTLGINGLAQRLSSLFHLLTRGRRTALPRHRTLEALITWSHDLLTHSEQVVLRRLSVFRSSFTLESAIRVAVGSELSASEAMDGVLSLLSKSLLYVQTCKGSDTDTGTDHHDSESRRYRMLYMTRAYAAQKLEEAEESHAVACKHAEHISHLANAATAQWHDLPASESVAHHEGLADDMCAALDWALAPNGNYAIGIELAISASHPVFQMDMNAQYRARLELALDRMAQLSPPQPHLELHLCVTWIFMSAQSLSVRRSPTEVYQRAVTLADAVGLNALRLETVFGMCVGAIAQCDYPAMARFSRQLRELGAGADAAITELTADRMLVLALHHQGQHDDADVLATSVMSRPTTGRRHWFSGQVPHSVSMRIVKARILWLQGCVDQAVDMADQAAQHAHGKHPFAICQALALAVIPIALWRGERQRASQCVDQLVSHASAPAMGYWLSWAQNYQKVLSLAEHSSASHPRLERADSTWVMPSNVMELDMLGTHAIELLSSQSVARVHQGLVGWCAPEILRASAEKIIRDHVATGSMSADLTARAEAHLMQALQIAQTQKALSWELRTASSLARLWQAQGRSAEAHDLVLAVRSRFNEGLTTADLIEADRLLCDSAPLQQQERSSRRA